MAFKITNPLTSSSPFQKHEPGHRFNLDEKLLNEKIDKTVKDAKNFKLDVPNFSKMSLGEMQQTSTPTTAQNFKKFNEGISAKLEQGAYDRATGTTDSRGGEASDRAFGDYAGALGNSQYYGERDQFGGRKQGVAEKKGGGLEADQRGPYAARDVAVPFSTMSKAQQKAKGLSRAEKKLQKELPYLSNYADYVPTQINPMYNDPNSGAFSNQIRRDQAAGVVGQGGRFDGASRLSKDNDQNFYGPNQSAHSYMGGYMHQDGFGNVSNRMFRPTDEMNDPFTQAVGSGGRDYRIGGGGDQRNEIRIGEAVGASSEAFNAIQDAISSGNFELANEILSSAQSGINETFQNPDKFSGTRAGSGGARYLNSPGEFYGNRVRDNFQYRTDQSNNSYNNEFLPTRNEQVDQEAMARLNAEKMRQMGIRMGNADYSVDFDTRGGQF
tara:strand:- start:283 stop:1599 length:1317 start_codon:yes stop_codon:yes gene_type:complete